MLAERHRRQSGVGLEARARIVGEERKVVLVAGPVEAADGPERIAPVEADRAERIRLGEVLQHGDGKLSPEPQVPHRIVARPPPGHESVHVRLAHSLDLPKTEPQGFVAQDVVPHGGMAAMDP